MARPNRLTFCRSSGAERIELAKITGITPPEFTFSGRKLFDAWVRLRPTIRLADWMGIRRSERSTKIMNATTANIITSSSTMAMGVKPPQVLFSAFR